MYKKPVCISLILLLLVGVLAPCRDVSAATSYVDTSDCTELDELYSDYFRVGVAVQAIDHWNDQTAEIGNEAKEDLIDRCFNSMTFGNELKPAYNFDSQSPTLFTVDPAAEELLDWAKAHDMPVRGHTLVWHSQVNPGIFAKDFKATVNGNKTTDWDAKLDEDCLVSRDELIKRLRTYIYGAIEYTYANGYGDVIYAWDVVNEATDEGAEQGLRNSYWKRIIGPEYLYYCFLFAREACVKYSRQYADLYGIDASDPDADYSSIMPQLFYNDYNEWFSARSNIIVRFISEDEFNPGQSMIKSDVIASDGDGTILGDGLIDGIGMQGHLDSTQNISEYTRALEKYDECIGNVHITELDVGINGSGEAAYYKQAKFYYDFFTALMDEVDKGVGLTAVTFWGLTDDASWRRGANPLLFKADLSRKSAFDALVMAGNRGEFEIEAAGPGMSSADLYIDFEPEEGAAIANLEQLGLTSRGTGHQSKLMLMTKENHTEGADKGFALKVSRSEQDATVKLDISGFAGEYVTGSLWVKTEDAHVTAGLEGGGYPFVLAEEDSDGEWTCIEFAVHIPEDWDATLYVETDGSADVYLDDISIDKIKEDEAAAKGALEPGKDQTESPEGSGAGQQEAEESGENGGSAGTEESLWSRIVAWLDAHGLWF
ncbi:MAG: endo-1,4-beta-xylanase [Lachnospiraceae bacterium]|nr:endo-1,4-beta-xylanase [Lachnospiraceae bacterium]